jgi:hypothetical protein
MTKGRGFRSRLVNLETWIWTESRKAGGLIGYAGRAWRMLGYENDGKHTLRAECIPHMR